jgi:ribonucleoside-diphosphate reductase alpha chain
MRKKNSKELLQTSSLFLVVDISTMLGVTISFLITAILLKAEEDSREDWANISWKSESCLMTGGGIGIDYSVYREEGRLLNGTGGLASGPIPKMQMINEIGRRVMQGGSRRSAIYASLNWKHPDVDKFLLSKNWYDMPIGTDRAYRWSD